MSEMSPVRQARLDAFLSPEALAEMAGVSVRTVHRLEQRVTANPQPEGLMRIAQALGIKPSVIVADLEAHRAGEKEAA